MDQSRVFQVEKPWGNFRQFTSNEDTTVKIISVNPNSSISLQRHSRRSEFWRVLSGSSIITIGSQKIEAKSGDEFLIKEGELHRIETKADATQILEISFGVFDENDIERLEDSYGRIEKQKS
jgi:mannose-1-phosphate guanylyltransferase/mannose-6-phosphate isomerase